MIGGYKVNATEVNRTRRMNERYMQTPAGQAKLNFKLYVVAFAIVALVLFG